MSEWYQIKARVISQKGNCSAGHKVGDEFIIVSALQSGGSFPWEKNADKTTVACPDAESPLVFELTRIKE
jgi:hypothetical protein